MPRTILVVDDQSNVRTLLREYLTEEGFRVVTAGDGREALYVARHEKPDLVLLDILMPEMNGYEFIRRFRMEKDTPVILLTARLEETDKVLGLELGADDYVTKPFGMRELLARIHAVLSAKTRYASGNLACRVLAELIGELHTVKVNDRPVDLTPSEFELWQRWWRPQAGVFTQRPAGSLHPEEAGNLEERSKASNAPSTFMCATCAPRSRLTLQAVLHQDNIWSGLSFQW
jgi:DNA-binding response OmpR family regulator